jgi:hypothetical protein
MVSHEADAIFGELVDLLRGLMQVAWREHEVDGHRDFCLSFHATDNWSEKANLGCQRKISWRGEN